MSARIFFGALVTRNTFRFPIKYLSCNSNLSKHTTLTHPVYKVFSSCHRQHASSTTNTDLGRQVYSGPIAQRIRFVKLFSLATSLSGLMLQPILVQKMLEDGASTGILIFSGVIIQFFTFVTPILLNYVTKRYVRAIYYNPDTDTYTALTYNFWTADRLISFKTDNVVVPDIPGILTNIIVKRSPLFVEASYFDNVSHYKRIMGFDKPIDFKLEENQPKP